MGFRSVLAVPMLRTGRPIGAIAVGRARGPAVLRPAVELLETFADQAVIAIENVRLFTELEARNRELTEALEQQTATGEILRVITSSPTDVQPVFDTIAEARARLCDADSGASSRYDGDAWSHLGIPDTRSRAQRSARVYPIGAEARRPAGRACSTARRSTSPTCGDDPSIPACEPASAAGSGPCCACRCCGTALPIGAIIAPRDGRRPFPDTQIELSKTFADQAVIAIENVRLFKELEARNRDLTETLEQQTATGEILRVISQLADRHPARVRHDRGERRPAVRGVRRRHLSHEGRSASPRRASRIRRSPTPIAERSPAHPRDDAGRSVVEGRTVHVADAQDRSRRIPGDAARTRAHGLPHACSACP